MNASLSSGDLDKKLFAEKSKEYSDVNEIIENAKNYISFENKVTYIFNCNMCEFGDPLYFSK